MVVCDYFLDKTFSETNPSDFFKYYKMNNTTEIIEFMLCSDINSIKQNYVSHITMYWMIYFMKFHNITFNEINAMDNKTFQDKSLEEIKYEMFARA